MAREKTKLIVVRVPARLSARYGLISRRRKVSVSAVVREAMEAYARRGEPSLWEAASHILETVKWRGPVDLSTNRKHLKDFGR